MLSLIMRKTLSYIWPQTKELESDYNGVLEVSIVNGQKILNSENANYSFGTLQRVLEIGLSKIELKNVSSVLLLGLGGGSVISSLRSKFNYKKKIVAVELDQKVIDIAENEFFISSSDNLTIENCDAFNFVEKCDTQYDLLIVDLFIDNKVPKQFYSKQFCKNLSRIMEEKGSIIFNLGIEQMNKIKKDFVTDYFHNIIEYNTFQFDNILGANTLLLVYKT